MRRRLPILSIWHLSLRTSSIHVSILCLATFVCLGSDLARAEAGASDLRTQIETELSRLSIPGAEVRVAVSEGDVLLHGTVRLLEHALRAEQRVWKTEGVRDVDNELRVVPVVARSDSEIEREIRSLLASDPRFLGVLIEIASKSGDVALRGRIPHPSDVLTLKHRVAAIEGVVSIEIDAFLVAFLREWRSEGTRRRSWMTQAAPFQPSWTLRAAQPVPHRGKS